MNAGVRRRRTRALLLTSAVVLDRELVALRAITAVLGLIVGCAAGNPNRSCGGITASGESSRIGLLAVSPPAAPVTILKRQVEGEDCPGGGAYGDYGTAIRNAIASVPGANVLTNVTLSSAESFGIAGVGICVRATGDAGRLE